MSKALRVLAVVAAAVMLAAPAWAVDEVFQQTYPLQAGGTFLLTNVNGSVHVSGWDRNEVEVHAVKTALGAQRDLARVRIDVSASPNRVAVETRYPQDDGVEVYVEYRIRVPRRVQLERVATVNGLVRVANVEATGDLRAVNGNVDVFDCTGRLSAHTTNGNLRLEMRRLDDGEPVVLETINGTILLALPAGSNAELDVRTINGDFRSELPLSLQGASPLQAFRGQIGQGGSTIQIRTVNGGIRVVTLRPTI